MTIDFSDKNDTANQHPELLCSQRQKPVMQLASPHQHRPVSCTTYHLPRAIYVALSCDLTGYIVRGSLDLMLIFSCHVQYGLYGTLTLT